VTGAEPIEGRVQLNAEVVEKSDDEIRDLLDHEFAGLREDMLRAVRTRRDLDEGTG
jgi:hypothetical protein